MGQAVSSRSRNRKGARPKAWARAAATQARTNGVLLFGLWLVFASPQDEDAG